MEKFQKTSFESVNGNVVVGQKLMARSLVVFCDKGVAFNVVAKCRNTDKRSVIKSLVKAVLAEKREKYAVNSTEAATKSLNKATDRVSRCLCGYAVAVTDKDGNILADSLLSVRKDVAKYTGKLRDVIRFTSAQPLYKLVVEQGVQWTDEKVVDALKWWVEAAINKMDYEEKLDAALEAAANSTEKEDKAAEKAAATEAKAA